MKTAAFTLILAAAWTLWIASVQQSPGIHSTPGIWATMLGLPGVIATLGLDRQDAALAHAIMFFVNWLFYLGVILFFKFVKQRVLQ